MSTRQNLLILASGAAAIFAVGMVSAEDIGSISPVAKGDRLFGANLECAGECAQPDAFVTIEYRGPNMSVLARVPVESTY